MGESGAVDIPGRLSILSERGRGDSIHAQPGRDFVEVVQMILYICLALWMCIYLHK